MSEFQYIQLPLQAIQTAPQQPPKRLLPPVRIRVAMEYLAYTAIKQMKHAAAHGLGVEIISGQQLSKAESNARESAANLLNDYFNGKMETDPWEKGELEAENRRNARMMGGQAGAILRCIACGHTPRENCPFCKGSGEVIMFPNKVDGGDE